MELRDYVERSMEVLYPYIYRKVIDIEERPYGEYIFRTNDGEVYSYDAGSESCRRVPANPKEMTEEQCAKEFAFRLKRRMYGQAITQKDLSELTGIPQSTISTYITGTRMPGFYNVDKIAKALNCPVDVLRYY